jgi:hypothetical protein
MNDKIKNALSDAVIKLIEVSLQTSTWLGIGHFLLLLYALYTHNIDLAVLCGLGTGAGVAWGNGKNDKNNH